MNDSKLKRGIFEKAGYRKMILWQNVYELRKMIYQTTKVFPKEEYRRISQMRDSARSSKQNLQEGYRLKSTKQFIRFLEIGHASLHELAGDVEDCYDDGILSAEKFDSLASLIGRTDYLFRRTIDGLNQRVLKGAS
jgi:four helix bundle protein